MVIEYEAASRRQQMNYINDGVHALGSGIARGAAKSKSYSQLGKHVNVKTPRLIKG